MTDEQPHRERCYGCYRPTSHCFCDLIPRIENQTNVLILQHSRERFHAFNTARITRRALVNSQIEVGFTPELAERKHVLSANAGLLYPGDESRLIDDVTPSDRPDQIVVLDGTWHHAKTMMRDIPWLADLPRFRIDPASPSRYRIRREPTVDSLSTVEATVDFLRDIEPNTTGLDGLLTAFNTMIDRHIAVIGSAEPRHRARQQSDNRVATNVPRTLLGDQNRIIVAYGESAPGEPGKRNSNVPVVWTAVRLGTGEPFYELVKPPCPLPSTVLNHMELNEASFDAAVSHDELRFRWQTFIRPNDIVFVFSKGTRRLLQTIGLSEPPCELLRSIDFANAVKSATLSELLDSLDIHPEPACLPGRAGTRLANAIALVRFARLSGTE